MGRHSKIRLGLALIAVSLLFLLASRTLAPSKPSQPLNPLAFAIPLGGIIAVHLFFAYRLRQLRRAYKAGLRWRAASPFGPDAPGEAQPAPLHDSLSHHPGDHRLGRAAPGRGKSRRNCPRDTAAGDDSSVEDGN